MEDEVTSGHAATSGGGAFSSDLHARLLAGIMLAAAVAGLAWAGVIPFALLVLAVALLMGWEWGRVVRSKEFDATFIVHGVSSTLAVLLAAFGLAALGLATVVIGAIICFTLEFGERPVLSALGAAYTGIPAVILLWLRSDEPWGFMAILFLFSVVVATDTLAYVCGRLIGGAKLWPRVSPNKTWAGLIGGVTAGALTGALFHLMTDSSPWALGLIGAALALVSQAGDLAESALKRAFGVKDASHLIPGHGGFMDRADGIVAAAVAAGVFALFLDPEQPAWALFGLF